MAHDEPVPDAAEALAVASVPSELVTTGTLPSSEVDASRRFRWLKRIGLLTVANLWSSGTTYAVFAVWANLVSRSTLGRYAIVTASVTILLQVVDGGSGLLMIRNVAKAPKDTFHIGETFGRRMRATLLAVIVLVGALWAGFHFDWPTILVAAGMLVGAALYGFVLQVAQSLHHFREMAIYQGLNGVLFIVAVVAVVMVDDRPSLALLVAAPASAFAILAAFGLHRVRQFITGREVFARLTPADRELRRIRLATFGTAMTAGVDQLLLGATSKAAVAIYAGAQRPAQGLAALSSAMTNVLLPAAAAGNDRTHRQLLRRTPALGTCAVLLGGLTGFLLHWPLSVIYGDRSLADPWILTTLFAAFSMGAISALPTSVLYARHRGDLVARAIWIQAVLILGVCVLGAVLRSALVTAGGVALGRLAYLLLQVRYGSRTAAWPGK